MAYNYSKPNTLAPRAEKLDPSYGLKFGQYIANKTLGNDFNFYESRKNRIREARAYAQGDQSNDKYKQIYNAEGDNSPLNLDWTPLGIGNKYFNALTQDVLGDFEVQVRAIDPKSISKRKEKRDKLLGAYYNRDYLQQFEEKTGINFSKEQVIPDSLEEVELHMTIDYKQSVEIAMKQAINYTMELNEYPDEIRRMVAADIICAGRGVVETRFDPNYGIRTEYVDAEYWVQSETNEPDGTDMQWGGVFQYMTIGDVKRMAGNDLSDKDYKEIQDKFKSRYGNEKFGRSDYLTNYNNTNDNTYYSKSAESYTVPVLKFFFIAVDCDRIKIVKSDYGERRYLRKDNYSPDKNNTNISVEDDEYEVVYEGYYIVGTDFIFNYGLMRDMIRPKNDLKKVVPPYKTYTTSLYNGTNKSAMELIMPYIDNINIAHLKMQQTIAKSHPEITTIDIESWLNISMGGRDWDPLELKDIFDAEGVVFHKSRDEDGNYIQDPVRSFPNKVNIDPFIASINFNMEMIRSTLGFTPEREGQTHTKQLVGVTELSIESSRNATYYINHALDSISRRVIEDVCWRIQDLEKGTEIYNVYEEAIGATDMTVISSMDEISIANFGIFVSTKPDNQEKLNLEKDIQIHINNKELRIEDAMMVRKLSKTAGIDTAYQYMKVRRDKYIKEQIQQKQALKEAETQRALQVQNAAAKAKQLEQQGEGELIRLKQVTDTEGNIRKLQEEYRLKSLLSEQEFEQNIQLEIVSERGQMNRAKLSEEAKDERERLRATFNAQGKEEIEKLKRGEKESIDEDAIGKQSELEKYL